MIYYGQVGQTQKNISTLKLIGTCHWDHPGRPFLTIQGGIYPLKHLIFAVYYPFYYYYYYCCYLGTLESGIEVGPTLINLAFFSRPYGLIRDYIKVIQMVIYYIGHVCLRPYVYSFCQIFQALCLFPALRLLGTLEQLIWTCQS